MKATDIKSNNQTFKYFLEISSIPRESGNEEGMREYLLKWAKDCGFEGLRDSAGNIIVRRAATKGFEGKKPVALQGHMDMVCVKRENSTHDFTKDPIDVVLDGDFLRARDTSLGGDNGIAVAMTMALFTDEGAEHGPLEAIFTFGEETGLYGAFALDASLIKSRRMINLDSEEEGVIYIGCAGGVDVKGSLAVKKQKGEGAKIAVKIAGLKGGHSGGEIHLQRVNAISAASRMIEALDGEGLEFCLVSFDGGTRRNVIPSTCSFEVIVDEREAEKAVSIIKKASEEIKKENRYEEPDFRAEVSLEKGCTCVSLSAEDSRKIVKALFASPSGVYANSLAVKGVVETSDNLAIARLNEKDFTVEFSVRSLSDSAMNMLGRKIVSILEAFGFKTNFEESYPSWTPDPSSSLASFCAKAWEDCTGKKAVLTSIHAGLECGVINSKIEGMDSVSIGPDLYDVHTVNEHLSISSTERMYDFVKYLLSITD
ncbi:MAG: aminoacyl-histidine dipeptidase [Sphaerochaetaceae bacterium]|nr:aminoacyl-histidine dipeptidase [Sphaerochaetaceae bacterium]